MDTTLRDGEQTPNVAYTPIEKLHLAKFLLERVRVDRIEIASAGVSGGERHAAEYITQWARGAGFLESVEILGFCDGARSIDWILGVGGRALNLLVKGSEKHCRGQLRLSPEEHRKNVELTVRRAADRQLRVSVYLEDWSNGIRHSPDYVRAMVNMLVGLPVARIYLPDTLGILEPEQTRQYVQQMVSEWPHVSFEFHGHNDYGFATANCLAAVRAGARGIHTSLNGMGERAGNAPLAQTVVAISDFTELTTGVDETQLVAASQLVEIHSGKDIAANTPITGSDVFTQTAGVHADGDSKGELYVSRLQPQRFNRQRDYALGKLSGKASLDQNLARLGLEVSDEERRLLLARITELGDKKHTVVPEDLPFILNDVLKRPGSLKYRIESYEVTLARSAEPRASVTLSDGVTEHSLTTGGAGGYDALMNAVRTLATEFGLVIPRLVDFRVRIPPSGRTEALVETRIVWQREDSDEAPFSTIGVDTDQLASAVIATEKMLNVVASAGAFARASTPPPSLRGTVPPPNS